MPSDIQLTVDLTADEAKATAEKLQGEIQKIFEKADGKKLSTQFMSLQNSMTKAYQSASQIQARLTELENTKFVNPAYEKLNKNLDSLSNSLVKLNGEQEQVLKKMNELASKKMPTKEYAEADKLFHSLRDKADALAEKMKRFVETGGKVNSKTYRGMEYDMKKLDIETEKAWNSMRKLEEEGKDFTSGLNSPEFEKARKKYAELGVEIQKLGQLYSELLQAKAEMEVSGTDKVDGTNTKEYDELLLKLANCNNAMALLVRRADEVNKKPVPTEKMKALESAIIKAGSAVASLAKDSFKTLKDAVITTASAVKNLVATVGKLASSAAVSGVKKLSTALFGVGKSANSSNINLKKAMRTLIKYTFGVRSFFFLYRKIRKAVTEGFAEMGQYSGELNGKISQVSTSLLYLRNALVTAFAPIVSYVAPAISQLLDLLSRAATAVGQFFAALFGATSFVRAKKVYKDYAQDVQKSQAKAEAKQEEARKKFEEREDARYEKYLKQKEKKEKAWQKKQLKLKKKYDKQLAGFDDVEILKKAEKEELEKEEMDPFDRKQYTAPLSSQDLMKPWEDFNNMFETVKIEAKFKELADKIKGFFKNEDWEGLGKFMANGINKAFKKIDKVLTSKKLRKKVDKFIDGIVGTFNSLVKNIDWKLIGKTIGDFVNNMIHNLNRLLTEIKWRNLGKSLADGLNSLINTIHWNELGQLFANKFNAMLNLAYGVIKNLHWGDLGKSLGDAINGLLLGIDWNTLADTFSELVNGIFEFLYKLESTIKWRDIADNITTALKRAVNGIKWGQIKNTLLKMLNDTLDIINYVVNKFNWADMGARLGNGINDAIHKIPWEKIGHTLANLGNKLFDFLYHLGETIDWEQTGKDLAKGIKKFIEDFDTEQFANTIDEWVQGLYDLFKSCIDGLDWDEVRDKIKGFIENLDFKTVKILLTALLLLKGPGFVLTVSGVLLSAIGKALAKKIAAHLVGGITIPKITLSLSGFGIVGGAARIMELLAAGGFLPGTPAFDTLFMEHLIPGIGKIFNSILPDSIEQGFDDFGKWWNSFFYSEDANGNLGPGKLEKFLSDIFNFENTKKFWDSAKEDFKKGGIWILKGLGEGLLGGVAILFDPILNLGDKVVKWVQDVFGISSPAKRMKPIGGHIIGGLLEGIKNKLADIGGWIKENIFDKFMDKLRSAFGISGNTSEKTKGTGSHIIGGLLDGIKNKLADIGSWIKENIFNKFMDKLKSAFGISGDTSEKTKGTGSSIIKGIKKGISEAWNSFSEFVKDIPGKIFKFLSGGRSWSEIGDNIIDGIWEGISNGWSWLKNKVGDVADSLLDKAKRALGIYSPSKLFRDQVGKMLPAGIAVGVDANAGQALSAIDNLTNDLTNAATKALVLPPIVGGKVIPYSVGKSTSDETNDTLTKVLDMLQYNQNTGITMADLTATLETLLRRYLNIRVQLGDVEVARSANRGNELLDRRFNPSIG